MKGGVTVTGVTPASGAQAYTIGAWTQITTSVIAANDQSYKGGTGMLYTDGTFLATNDAAVPSPLAALATAIMARRVVYAHNYLGFVPLPAFSASPPLKGHIAEMMVFFDSFSTQAWGGDISPGSLFCTLASQSVVQETEAPPAVEDTPAPSADAAPGVCTGLLTHRYQATSVMLVGNVASVADSGVVFPRLPMTLGTSGSGGYDVVVQNALLLSNAMNATVALNTGYGSLGRGVSGFTIRLVVRVDELPVRCVALHAFVVGSALWHTHAGTHQPMMCIGVLSAPASVAARASAVMCAIRCVSTDAL
jgi:hypothetical protein